MNSDPQILTFEFSGKTTPRKLSHSEPDQAHQDPSIVIQLNDSAPSIAAAISDDLRRSLPRGLDVQVQLKFNHGSVEWAGVVLVVDWLARISGSVAMVAYLSRAIQISVDRIVTQHVHRSVSNSFDTTTDVRHSHTPVPTSRRRAVDHAALAAAAGVVNIILLTAIFVLIMRML